MEKSDLSVYPFNSLGQMLVVAWCTLVVHEMRRRAKTGIFTKSRIAPKASATQNSATMTARGNGTIAIP
jgi:hypothetical protein